MNIKLGSENESESQSLLSKIKDDVEHAKAKGINALKETILILKDTKISSDIATEVLELILLAQDELEKQEYILSIEQEKK
ncbi:MAG: hypothetical protein SFT93_01625 [Rickettsiaceae bacterium]|nr:hypothetical protein [Rickettsiaceae bacterium]